MRRDHLWSLGFLRDKLKSAAQPIDGRMSFSARSHVLRSLLCFESQSFGVARGVLNQFYRGIRRSGSLSAMYKIEERGNKNTEEYRIYLTKGDGPISPLHDIPMYADSAKKIFNMVVEIPRWTNAKMEIDLKSALNPLRQDIKKGKLRYVANCFPHHGYIWNYGAIPQTWEDPNVLDESTGCKGDNDPIDALEIGSKVAQRGEVIQVKVLGTLALIDEGETDWKIICISITDPAVELLKDITDVDRHFPGLLKATIEWFKIYKVADGKSENQFAFNGEAKNKDFALKVIDHTHKSWKNLLKKDSNVGIGISCANTTLCDSPFSVSAREAKDIVGKNPPHGPPAPLDPSVESWSFVHLK